MLRLASAWLLPIADEPVARGAVLLGDDGRILAAGPDDAVPRPERAEQRDLGDAILLPGFVNTHTHLELTGLAGAVEDDEFWSWIRHLIAVKAARSDEAFFLAARQGILDCWAAGVTTFCDTGSTGQVIAALADLRGSGIVHHEVFGPHPDECDRAMAQFARDLDRLAHHATGRVRLGVSPHAPYTVSGPLYRASAELARAHGVPIAVHVAEPQGETALLADFTGTFADSWKARGIPRPAPEPVSPMAWLDRHGVLSPRTLCIHALHVDDADADLMRRSQCAMAHCPRSNRRHHDADAPMHRYRARGLRIGLGTDSEVSVAPLDLLAEARAAQPLGEWTDRELLRLLTLGGAEALDLAHEIGALRPGLQGDLVAIDTGPTERPEAAVLGSRREQVAGTWLGGRPVHAVTRP